VYLPDIISKIREGTLCWLGHVERTPEERILKKKCWRISQKGKCPFESQVRDGWKVLKMI
jgi:hypothetical protein